MKNTNESNISRFYYLDYQRERSQFALHTGYLIYFLSMGVSVFGLVSGFFSKSIFYVIIIIGLISLVVGAIPYIRTDIEASKEISKLAKKL